MNWLAVNSRNVGSSINWIATIQRIFFSALVDRHTKNHAFAYGCSSRFLWVVCLSEIHLSLLFSWQSKANANLKRSQSHGGLCSDGSLQTTSISQRFSRLYRSLFLCRLWFLIAKVKWISAWFSSRDRDNCPEKEDDGGKNIIMYLLVAVGGAFVVALLCLQRFYNNRNNWKY